jgi:hypothetical protein
MLRIVCRHSAAEARADVNQGVVRSLIMPNGFLCYRNHALTMPVFRQINLAMM